MSFLSRTRRTSFPEKSDCLYGSARVVSQYLTISPMVLPVLKKPSPRSRVSVARAPGFAAVVRCLVDATVASTRQRTTAAKPGALATLTRLLGEGFFKTGKTIGDIVKYCETTLALPYKQSDFSGKLVRLVRDKKLTREKNAEGQYEDRKSTRLNSSHDQISYAVFCLKKKKQQ